LTREPPEPPLAEVLSPAIDKWKAGKPLTRIYHRRRGPLVFNPTKAAGRFRPIYDNAGKIVPTAYAGEDQETALAEGLLRGVEAIEAGHRRRLFLKQVQNLSMVTLLPKVDLTLARLHGQGLQRLELLREDVVDCNASRYPYTAEWAQAIYSCSVPLAGIVWTSRQNDSGKALVLWEGSLDPKESFEKSGPSLRLDDGPGLDLVRQACAYAHIDFEG
jgi:hypothetical protein